MAYLKSFYIDAGYICDEILKRNEEKELNLFDNHKKATTIQRWFRGYITRKHLTYLNAQATTIQKHWRGYCARHLYFLSLKKKVKEFYEESYNRCAVLIQKTWRGYLYREFVFSYIKLKKWKALLLKRNRFLFQLVENYRRTTWNMLSSKMEKEAEEWLLYVLFKAHHLQRTTHRKGVYSLKEDTKEKSPTEELLNLIAYGDFIAEKKRKVKLQEEKVPMTSYQYKFDGALRKCEIVWLKRYAPNFHSVFASGIYGEEEELQKIDEFLEHNARIIHDNPMKFGKINHSNIGLNLDYKTYKCPPKHKKNIKIKNCTSENCKDRSSEEDKSTLKE